MLGRFWVPKLSQSRRKIAPGRVQKGIENHFCFLMPSWTSKNRFFGQHGSNMARSWPPGWPQVGSNMGSKSSLERFPGRSRLRGRSWSDFGSILGRFWIDLGTILDRFWTDAGQIFGWFSVKFCLVAGIIRICLERFPSVSLRGMAPCGSECWMILCW